MTAPASPTSNDLPTETPQAPDALLDALRAAYEAATDKVGFINEVRSFIHRELSPFREHPVDLVLWLPLPKVQPNDYNPNAVAAREMQLLHTSITHDGYTQPVVTAAEPGTPVRTVIDGFHRYFSCRTFEDIRESTQGHVPVVTLHKTRAERMAATVRHNRARGKHSVSGMSSLVFQMLDEGRADEDICNELGMEPEELLRLKHITGFSKLFEDHEYSRAWISRHQAQLAARARQQGSD